MAENNEDRNTEDLSDEASPYRLEEFRKKGQVAQSKELVALIIVAAMGAVLFSMGPSLGDTLVQYFRDALNAITELKLSPSPEKTIGDHLWLVLKTVSAIGLPIASVGLVLGVLGHLVQIGVVFSFDPIQPDLEKVNPLSGVKRLFSGKNLIETARVVIKGAILCIVSYLVIKQFISESPRLIFQHPTRIFDVLGEQGKNLFFSLIGVLAVFAGVDFFLQRQEFGKQVRVTKQEAKQEAKEQEGDPMIKARIRSIQRERARKRMMAAVKKADVIITNPTHIAIALQYDKEKMVAPRVVAKGADFMAEKIKELARSVDIPLVENVPLARALFKSVKVGQTIPKTLFQAVAEVLAYIYRLKNRKF